jgi:hypothetical protein
MGLAEQQRLLARLATDTDLRESFSAAPDAIGLACGCSPEDILALTHAPPGQLSLFARSLHSKRLMEVRKLLPLSCHTLGPQAAPLFCQFADMSVPTGLHRHQQDALAFADFLLRLVISDSSAFPAWLSDLLRYESGWLRAADPACRWHAVRLRHVILPLIQSLAEGETPVVLQRPALACWWRVSRSSPLRHRIFTFVDALRVE